MTRLAAHLEALGEDLERAARRRVAWRRRRRRIQTAVVVAATLLVATGAGLAAGGFDLLGWLRSDNPSEARYLVDTTETYAGPAPTTIECESVAGETFVCRKIEASSFTCQNPGSGPYPCGEPGRSQRIYWLSHRVERAPRLSRELFVRVVDEAEREDRMPKRLAAAFRDAASDVSDEFLARLDLLMQVQGGETFIEGRGGREVQPPEGVPLTVTCEPEGESTLRCRDVAGATDVPLRAPIYMLEPTADWVPRETGRTPGEGWAEIEAFFGRPLTRDENLLFLLLGLTDDTTAAEWARLERALERAGVLE